MSKFNTLFAAVADAARHMPAAGDYSVQAESAVASDVTRAEVRAEVRDALAHGFHIAAGERA